MERREKLTPELREEMARIDAISASLHRLMERHGLSEIHFWRRVKAEFKIPLDRGATVTVDRSEVVWQEE